MQGLHDCVQLNSRFQLWVDGLSFRLSMKGKNAMAKKVTAKSIAAAAPAGARAPDFLLELEADGWLPVHLPDAGRNPNITKDFIIFDKSETLSSFGIEDGPSNSVEAVTHTVSEKVKTEINSIGDLSVVKAMRIPKPSVTITLDTEYYTDENGKRHILSWQFCFIKNGLLYKVLVFPYNDGLLIFKEILSFLIQYYGLNEPFVKMDGLKFKDYRRWEVPEKTLFSRDDWRNATRKSRLYQLLPEEDFLPLLLKMLAADT